MAWGDREGWLNLVFLGDGRVEDEKERDEAYHHETQRLGEFRVRVNITIPDMPRKSPNQVWNYTYTRSSPPNQACRTPDFAYRLVSSTFFSSSSPISVFLVHNSTIIAEYKFKSSLCISPCHDHEITPNTAYIEYNIHRVLHTPSPASTQDCLSFFHSHNYELTTECSFSYPACHPTLLTAISQLGIRAERLGHLVTFPCLRVNYLMKRVSPRDAPSIDWL